MLGKVFYWIFNMSVTGAIMGLVVLLLRRIRAIPRRISIFLWLAPYLRMTVPVWLSSRYSLMELISRFATRTVTVFVPMDGIELTLTNVIGAANSYFPLTFKENVLDGLFRTAGIVWAAVAAAMIVGICVVYALTFRSLRGARRVGKRTFVSDKAQGPAVFGIIRPKIVLTPETENDRFVLLHEETHIRRLDDLWRLLAVTVTAVHWFDPFSWVFLKAFLADIELACDETAISKLDDKERKEYALALVNSAEQRSLLASAFGGAKLKRRIEGVVAYRGVTLGSAICFAVLAAAIVWLLLTNAR